MHKLFRFGALAAGAVAALTASQAFADDTYTAPSVMAVTATLVDSTGAAAGNVQLNQDADGTVQIVLDATKLPAGAHGIHLHAAGVCEGPAFTTAAAHVNPAGKKHGLNSPDGPHAGDLPQVDSTTVVRGYYTVTTSRISLTAGPVNISDADGTALVVHASADDQVTDATGNSGARIACAVLAAPATPVVPSAPATGSGFARDEDGSRAAYAGFAALTALAAGCLLLRRRA